MVPYEYHSITARSGTSSRFLDSSSSAASRVSELERSFTSATIWRDVRPRVRGFPRVLRARKRKTLFMSGGAVGVAAAAPLTLCIGSDMCYAHVVNPLLTMLKLENDEARCGLCMRTC